MALYAVDEDDLIHAQDAEPRKIYFCMDCFGPVKRRRGNSYLPHFYHLSAAPRCKLYSKTQDHFLVQLQLEKYFPKNWITLERPFIQINRVADACFEKEKVVFEIQCSQISEKEAQMRIRDYRSIGYEVVWLLDDRKFNRRNVRPAEMLLRKGSCYFVSIQRNKQESIFYDQFEIIVDGKRVRKSKKMPIDLKRPYPFMPVASKGVPHQINSLDMSKYFRGDRLFRAHANHHLTLEYWKNLEKQHRSKIPSRLKEFFNKYIAQPYIDFLDRRLKGGR